MSVKSVLSCLAFFALVSSTLAFRCVSDEECCASASCIVPRGGQTKQCVLPNDALCQPCAMGFHYKKGVCVPEVFPCRDKPCAAGQVCVYSPKRCVRAPCPQYSCVAPDDACPKGEKLDEDGVCVPVPPSSSSSSSPSSASLNSPADCIMCPQVMPRCKFCDENQVCKIHSQTCHTCAYAECVARPAVTVASPQGCVICPQVIPKCKHACNENEVCLVHRQTCQKCAYAECVSRSVAAAPKLASPKALCMGRCVNGQCAHRGACECDMETDRCISAGALAAKREKQQQQHQVGAPQALCMGRCVNGQCGHRGACECDMETDRCVAAGSLKAKHTPSSTPFGSTPAPPALCMGRCVDGMCGHSGMCECDFESNQCVAVGSASSSSSLKRSPAPQALCMGRCVNGECGGLCECDFNTNKCVASDSKLQVVQAMQQLVESSPEQQDWLNRDVGEPVVLAGTAFLLDMLNQQEDVSFPAHYLTLRTVVSAASLLDSLLNVTVSAWTAFSNPVVQYSATLGMWRPQAASDSSPLLPVRFSVQWLSEPLTLADVDDCELPRKVGPCKAMMPRWYFSAQTQQCEQFIYGGCAGNANNFVMKEECELRCLARV